MTYTGRCDECKRWASPLRTVKVVSSCWWGTAVRVVEKNLCRYCICEVHLYVDEAGAVRYNIRKSTETCTILEESKE